jgi:hypothetical protein
MANSRQVRAITQKQIDLRNQLWPDVDKAVWDRTLYKGFTTIPKTMPLILKIMDEMTKNTPVSDTYLSLWCSTWDNSFVSLSKPGELAYTSGFTGNRAEYTWGTRVKLLQELRFVDVKAGKSGPSSHALIWNPHFVIRWHYQQKTPGLRDESYGALLEAAIELGVKDMTNAIPLPPPFAPEEAKPAGSKLARPLKKPGSKAA